MAPKDDDLKDSIFHPCTLYDGLKSVMIDVNGEEVEVQIDDENGPQLLNVKGGRGGATDCMGVLLSNPRWARDQGSSAQGKSWKSCTSTERKMLVFMAAKINKQRQALK
eukprot:TRINITY_DN73088_c0_g1_i1.p1 TRINITY_DN73088_c0_g1~~TRINITY_DN73088_c0_g1_i1.p1  ORF type:complete len:109 (+),score=25.75 TRINITY_DN73088_c0_g1_i1:88-414(+)